MLLQLKKIKSDAKPKIFSWKILKDISVIAIPSILQQSFISVGNIVIQSVVNSFGEVVMAGYSASVKLNNLVTTSFLTFANGISNYTSQNLGAGKTERIKPGFRAGLGFVWILCVPIVLVYIFAGKYLLMLFMKDAGSGALDIGMQFLRIVSPFYFVVAVKIVCDGVLRGGGRMVKFMITTFTDLILRVVLALVLSGPLGTQGIWWSWPIGWGIGMIVSLVFYLTLKWKKPLPEDEYVRLKDEETPAEEMLEDVVESNE